MKILSTRINNNAFNTGMLVLRLGFGILLLHHGYQKITHFQDVQAHMMSFMGLSPAITTSLVIFAEVFCAAMVILGLFTRIAAFIVVFNFSVAFFMAHNHDAFGAGEMPMLYLLGYLAILICGPGRVSVDSMISK